MSYRKLVLLIAIAAPWTLTLGAQFAARESDRTVAVPDFKHKTVAQVQAQVDAHGNSKAMFADIIPQGPANGVVVAQTPLPETRVVPGYSRLVLTLETPKPSGLGNFLGQLLAPVVAQQLDGTNVPPLSGLTQDVASQRLQSASLQGKFIGETAGVVTQQSIPPGTRVKRGATVTVTFSLSQATVPVLDQMSLTEANARLQQSYLQLGTTAGANVDGATVSSQSLPPGAQVPRGTAVNVTMEASAPPRTPAPVTVPNLLSMTNSEAADALDSLKLKGVRLRGPITGLVSSQTKPAGSSVALGTRIGYTLSLNQVAVPDLINNPSADASSTLQSLGLNARISYAPGAALNASLIVSAQNPAPQTMVDENSTVSITLDQASAGSKLTAILHSEPPWVWIVTAAAALGLLAKLLIPSAPLPPAICTLAPSAVSPSITTGTPGGPAIHFSITLRDQIPEPQYHAPEPSIIRKG